MGLDLILYKYTKDNMALEEELDAELAYGRKTWSIADFFRERCKCLDWDWYYQVTKADWDEFIDSLEKLNDPAFRQKVEDFIELYDTTEVWNDKLEKLYNELEEWYSGAVNNDTGYQLGFDWELRAVLDWFDANEEVQQAFKDGIDVRLIVSY